MTTHVKQRGKIFQREGAERLGIGVRQFKRLVRSWKQAGEAGLVSRQPGATHMATTVKVTSAMVQQALQEIDWAAIDVQTDEVIARNVAGDPDAAPILSEAGHRALSA